MMARITTSETGGLRVARLRSSYGERGPGCTCPAQMVLGKGETLERDVSAPLSFLTTLASSGSMSRSCTERDGTIEHARGLSPGGVHGGPGDEHRPVRVVQPMCHAALRRHRPSWLPH